MNESGEFKDEGSRSLARRCRDFARGRPKTTVLALAAFAVCVWFAFVGNDRDLPRYNGKTAEQWFYGERGHPGIKETMDAAEDAFAAMEEECIPYLIQKLRSKDTKLDELWRGFHPKLPKAAQARFRAPVTADYVQMVSLRYLSRFGADELTPFWAELKAAVMDMPNADRRWEALQFMQTVAVWQEDGEKVAFFVELLEDPDFRIRMRAAVMLSRIDPTLAQGFPILIEASTNRARMAQLFPQFGGGRILNGGLGLPWPDQARFKQREAHQALAKVSPKLAEQFPVVGPRVPTRSELPGLLRAIAGSDGGEAAEANQRISRIFHDAPEVLRRDGAMRKLRSALGRRPVDKDLLMTLAAIEEKGEDWEKVMGETLLSTDEVARSYAIRMLGDCAGGEASEGLLRQLVRLRENINSSTHGDVFRALRKLRRNDSRVQGYLDQALEEVVDAQSRLRLISSYELESARVVEALRQILRKGGSGERARAVELLKVRNGAVIAAMPELIAALEHQD